MYSVVYRGNKVVVLDRTLIWRGFKPSTAAQSENVSQIYSLEDCRSLVAVASSGKHLCVALDSCELLFWKHGCLTDKPLCLVGLNCMY